MTGKLPLTRNPGSLLHLPAGQLSARQNVTALSLTAFCCNGNCVVRLKGSSALIPGGLLTATNLLLLTTNLPLFHANAL